MNQAGDGKLYIYGPLRPTPALIWAVAGGDCVSSARLDRVPSMRNRPPYLIYIGEHRPMRATNKVNIFPDYDIRHIESVLGKINNLLEISWEFRQGELEVGGVLSDDEPLIFTHSRAAIAYLEGFLEGYDVGYGDGRSAE